MSEMEPCPEVTAEWREHCSCRLNIRQLNQQRATRMESEEVGAGEGEVWRSKCVIVSSNKSWSHITKKKRKKKTRDV